jgi:hypothetical protein
MKALAGAASCGSSLSRASSATVSHADRRTSGRTPDLTLSQTQSVATLGVKSVRGAFAAAPVESAVAVLTTTTTTAVAGADILYLSVLAEKCVWHTHCGWLLACHQEAMWERQATYERLDAHRWHLRPSVRNRIMCIS